ncbi:MAG: hypothetical protein ACK5KP_09250, partial [Paludibacteraceae bacterium]
MRKICLLFILFVATISQAATIYVKPASFGGDDTSGDGTSWATAYATPIKAFSMTTASDDVIAIMQGTYNLDTHFDNATNPNIQVLGGYTGTADERVIDPANTVFEYSGSAAVRVLGTFGTGLIFSGITFQNLQPAASQYGIFVNIGTANVTLTLEDCVVKNFVNKAGAYVRGIIRFNTTATVNINRCQFISCEEKSTANYNAVISRNGGNATVNISNSIIKGTA